MISLPERKDRTDDPLRYRLDITISYWILLWYFLFVARVTTLNPLLPLSIAFLHNMIGIVYMFIVNESISTIIAFTIILLLVKAYPLYSIWGTKIRGNDVIAACTLLLVYMGWLYIHKTNIFDVYITRQLQPGSDLLLYAIDCE